MYELMQVTERFFYVDCPAKIGIYKISDSEVALIDSGNNKGAATKVLRIAEATPIISVETAIFSSARDAKFMPRSESWTAFAAPFGSRSLCLAPARRRACAMDFFWRMHPTPSRCAMR